MRQGATTSWRKVEQDAPEDRSHYSDAVVMIIRNRRGAECKHSTRLPTLFVQRRSGRQTEQNQYSSTAKYCLLSYLVRGAFLSRSTSLLLFECVICLLLYPSPKENRRRKKKKKKSRKVSDWWPKKASHCAYCLVILTNRPLRMKRFVSIIRLFD